MLIALALRMSLSILRTQSRFGPTSAVLKAMVEEAKLFESSQRVQVQMERHPQGKRVKIRVESYDDGLGWYTAGSLTVPLHQLPLLEQAVDDMRKISQEEEFAEIIPFPGLMAGAVA